MVQPCIVIFIESQLYNYIRPAPSRCVTLHQGYLSSLRVIQCNRQADGPKQAKIGTAGAAGMVAREGENISVSQLCVGIREILRGEVRESGRRQYTRYVLRRITSGTVRTGYRDLPCMECPRIT